MKIGDDEAFKYARRMIKEEGFLCGGSSGTAMAAAIKYIKEHNIGAGKRCVVVCPDNIRNYITKFVNNDWMFEHGFISEQECLEANVPKLVPHDVWGKQFTIKDLHLPSALILDKTTPIREAIKQMKANSFDQFPVRDTESGELVGVVTTSLVMTKLSRKKANLDTPLGEVMSKEFRNMSSDMPISELSRVLERQNFVIVDSQFVASPNDVLNFMVEKEGV